MEIDIFTDQYEMAAGLYGTTDQELRRRDDRQSQPLQRWLAVDGGVAVGAVTTWLRPDDRTFLMFAGREPAVHAALAEAAAAALGRSVYTIVDADERDTVEALTTAGFATEAVGERFRIRFDQALLMLERAWIPSGVELHPADTVDENRLFTLDNTIRQDVLGTDGWSGDRQSFHEELTEAPPFDSTAYLVAVDHRNGEYAGLVRMWRNPSGPRLGLVGVTRRYRNTPIAAALLKQAITAASEWGYESFTTETNPCNRVIYPRVKRLDAKGLGRFLQLARH